MNTETAAELPVYSVIPDICEALSSQKNVVLSAEPGAGKSTTVPLALLNENWLGQQKIMMLQPRRIAAKSIAHYLSKKLGESVGETVGYQVRNDSRVSSKTRLVIVTEGILTRKIQQDPELTGIGLVIFDEFHERSIHCDLGLMFANEIQQSLRDDLRLLVMSATVDTTVITKFLTNTQTIMCPGRTFPVEISYQKPIEPKMGFRANAMQMLSTSVLIALKSLLSVDKVQDILVFLPGQAEIKRSITTVQEYFESEPEMTARPLLVSLYGALNLNDQQKALQPDPHGRQKIIFTTNIAETSLTVEGVSAVVDSGLEKRIQFDPASGLNQLKKGWIAKSSAKQRSGRAGRLGPGRCIRLWSEEQEKQFNEFQQPEIENTDLSSLILQLSCWGNPDYDSIHWLSKPSKAHFEQATALLQNLDLVDSRLKLTAAGKRAVSLPLMPRLARMLICAGRNSELACLLASLLEVRDVFHNADSADLELRITAVKAYLNGESKSSRDRERELGQGVNRALLQQIKTQIESLQRKCLQMDSPVEKEREYSAAELLLFAFPDRLAQQRPGSPHRYILANGKGVSLQEHDPLTGSQWLVVSDCELQAKDGRIFSAISITPSEIKAVLSQRLTTHEQVSPDKQQRLCVRTETRYEALVLDKNVSYSVSKEQRQAYIEHFLLENGLKCLNWCSRCQDWLRRASWLGQYIDTFPHLNEQALEQRLAEWLLPYLPEMKDPKDIKKINVYPLLTAIISWEEQQILDAEAPEAYLTPSGKQVKITYDPQQGPVVSVQLQEVFGELSSPMLGKGNVPLRFELLSPARRPLQTTSDLAGFWQSSYFDVAKEMRGRYPKHRWPEEPLKEKAGRSIKPKSQR